VVADADGVHPGTSARLALRVSLPDGVHVQSNAPRDPMLIATAATVTAPDGVTLEEIAYPPAKDFRQQGQATPLAVFEQQFAIGIRIAVAAEQRPGDVVVPIRLRYQACDATTCFAPLREDLNATLHVVPTSVSIAPQHRDLFDGLRFRR
jgi:DsbC/DsbD-like thiol-disulfide interchange protein